MKHKQTQIGLLELSKYEINFPSNIYMQLPNKFTEQATKIIKYWILQSSGYMSPEYAVEGLFSMKSDVFSFGVLLLEIVSGKKNTGFYNSASLNLLAYVCSFYNLSSSLCFCTVF